MTFKPFSVSHHVFGPLTALAVAACPSCCMEDGVESSVDVPEDLGQGLSVSSEDGREPADFSCFGKTNAPGKNAAASLPAVAFGIRDDMGAPVLVPGLEIQIFAENEIPADLSCEEGCELANDLGNGTYDFEVPKDGWFAYRIVQRPAGKAGPSVLPTVERNFLSAPDEAFNVMLEPVLDGLHEALGFDRDPERSLVAGRVLDCNGEPVEGATIVIYDEAGEPIDADESAVTLYLDDQGPNPELSETSEIGQWSVANVPVGSGRVQVQAFDQNGNAVSCEVAATAPSALSVIRLRPLRADGPECFGLPG